MFKIEKNVPLPNPGRNETGVTSALRAMSVGDSFVIDKPAVNARVGLFALAGRAGVSIATRTQPDGSLRVWRVERKGEAA